MGRFSTAFIMCLVAGLSTGIGSLFCLLPFKRGNKFMAGALGFSAGVMIYISFVEIMPKSIGYLITTHSEKRATLISIGAFALGICITALIDLVFSEQNLFARQKPKMLKMPKAQKTRSPLSPAMRAGVITAIALMLHNMPEGLATFVSAYASPALGLPIVMAVALHNIPEGIAVYAPIYLATNSKKKAFALSFASGLTEPIGALIGWFALSAFINDLVYGIVFALIAGIMVFISLKELLPLALEFDSSISFIGLFVGMIIMAISLYLFI